MLADSYLTCHCPFQTEFHINISKQVFKSLSSHSLALYIFCQLHMEKTNINVSLLISMWFTLTQHAYKNLSKITDDWETLYYLQNRNKNEVEDVNPHVSRKTQFQMFSELCVDAPAMTWSSFWEDCKNFHTLQILSALCSPADGNFCRIKACK